MARVVESDKMIAVKSYVVRLSAVERKQLNKKARSDMWSMLERQPDCGGSRYQLLRFLSHSPAACRGRVQRNGNSRRVTTTSTTTSMSAMGWPPCSCCSHRWRAGAMSRSPTATQRPTTPSCSRSCPMCIFQCRQNSADEGQPQQPLDGFTVPVILSDSGH